MQIDALGITPSALSLLSTEGVPPCLKQITTVGEPLGHQLVNKWAEKVELRVSYGLSEVAQLNFARRLRKGDDPHIIGAPKDTTQAFIFEPGSMRQLAFGHPGELCLSGPQVAQGYFARPEQTSESFVQDFGRYNLYRTGDLAVQHEEGAFEILGRIDYQVKIHGQRVEPNEVAIVISGNTEARSVAVLGADIKGRISLVAAVVPADNVEWGCLVETLRSTAQGCLPPYMVPGYWMQLSSLPVNANGKVDIADLRRRAQETSIEEMLGRSSGHAADETELNTEEEVIRSVWSAVLGIQPSAISRSSSFVTLGGSSVDAIQVVRELRLKGFEMELGDILRAPRLSEINYKIVGDASTSAVEMTRFSLVRNEAVKKSFEKDLGVVDAFPLTQLQGSLMASTLDGNLDYLYQRTYDVRHLDLVKLKLAFQVVFSSSEILRTTFTSSDAGILQIVRNDFALPWKHADMSLADFKSEDKQRSVRFEEPFVRFTVVNQQLLVVSMHHSLFDFWSHDFLYEDVARLYLGLMPIERPSFGLFVRYLQQQSPDSAHQFWREYLEHAEPSVINPVPLSENHSRSQWLQMDVKSVTRALNVTSSSLIYAAWALLLSRHTGLSEAVFATAIAGREAPIEGAGLLDGPTLTIVPQRIALDAKASLADLVRQTHNSFWDVLKHSQHGMRRALAAANHDKAPLLDTMVNILVNDRKDEAISGKIFHPYGPKPTWQTEWTTLDVEEDENGFLFRMNAAMPARRIEYVLGQLAVILAQMQQNANVSHASIDALGADERAWLSSSDYTIETKPQTLHGRFEAVVQKYPGNIAVAWLNGESTTYAQLDVSATQMANFLLQQGVKSDQLIPIILEKSPLLIIVILAILKTGAAYVPLSPENPVQRNVSIAQETDARFVLTETAHQGYFAGHDVTTLLVDQIALTEQSVEKPLTKVLPEQLAYVIYTSGSTGQPKGVMIEHQAVASAIESIISFEGREGRQFRTLQFSNYVFDVSVYDIFVPLSSGHTLCMAPTDKLLSDLPAVINEMEVNHCFLTPTVARLLDPKAVPSLKVLTVGGESVTSDIVEKWSKDRELLNGYGPTETSILATMKSIKPETKPSDIGRPLPTIKAFIIEPNGHRFVPWGAVGELCFSGPQLGDGYLKKPEQTEAAFLEYDIQGVRKVYRTGDLARWLPNGDIECLGRKDNQIKLNGYRVELGEVEQAILCANCVRDAVVVVVESNGKSQMLAWVVFNDHSTLEDMSALDKFPDKVSELKESFKSLAHYMVPKMVVPLPQMPKLPSGKTNRKELKANANSMNAVDLSRYMLDSSKSQGPVIAPETDAQRLLQSAWAKTLSIGADQFGLEADFLGLGGDSIGAIELASYLRKHDYILSVGEALSVTNLKEMANCLVHEGPAEQQVKKAFEPSPSLQNLVEHTGLRPDDFEYIYPCPPGQAEFLDHGARKEQHWVVMTVRPLPESTDIEAWIQTATKLAEVNEILRTTFVQHEKTWYGVVLKDAKPRMDIVGVTSEDARKSTIEALWQTRFHFGEPFIRYNIMRMSDGTRQLVTKMDHGLYDGTLLRVFDAQFIALQHNDPVPTFTPFRDFASHIYSSNKQRTLGFWSKPSQRPTTFAYPAIANPSITKTHVQATNLPDLDAYAKRTAQTPSIIFQTAFQIWLALRSRQLDVSFDYLYTGRNVELPDPQSINGTCANFLPLRSRIEPEQPLSRYLAQTSMAFWKATENGNVGVAEIVDACGMDKASAKNTALFLYQPFDPPKEVPKGGGGEKEDMRWVVMAKSEVRMPQPYAVVFEIMRTRDGYRVRFGYDAEVFDEEGAKSAVGELERVVRGMIEVGVGMEGTMEGLMGRLRGEVGVVG